MAESRQIVSRSEAQVKSRRRLSRLVISHDLPPKVSSAGTLSRTVFTFRSISTVLKVTSLNDIAGQLTSASHDTDKVTVGGVCLPSGALSKIRRDIPAGFPKWRDATDAHVEFMMALVCRESLGVAASSLDKGNDLWRTFWKDAARTHAAVANRSGGSVGFIKAASLLKFLMFGQSATISVAHAINSGALPRVVDSRRRLEILQTVVFDTDIQGTDNIEAFVQILRSMNMNQPLTRSLGIDWTVSTMRIDTEQDEPLLLMADYVAGAVHAVNSKSNTLGRSLITSDAAIRAIRRLSNSGRFIDFPNPVPLRYFDIFPEFEKLIAKPSS